MPKLDERVLLAALAIGAVLLLVVANAARRLLLRFRIQARSARAFRGEARAADLLERAGYAIVARQLASSWAVSVDGERVEIGVRADYLVEQGGRRFVAEVKTGRAGTRIEHAPTRRQLLEYRFAFDVDGVLLVDAESDTVHEVVFAIGAPSGPRLGWLALGAIAIAAVAWIVVSRP